MVKRWGIEGEFPNACLYIGHDWYWFFFYIARRPIRFSVLVPRRWALPRISLAWLGFSGIVRNLKII